MNEFLDLEGLVQRLGTQQKKRKPNGIGKGKARIPHVLISVGVGNREFKVPEKPMVRAFNPSQS